MWVLLIVMLGVVVVVEEVVQCSGVEWGAHSSAYGRIPVGARANIHKGTFYSHNHVLLVFLPPLPSPS